MCAHLLLLLFLHHQCFIRRKHSVSREIPVLRAVSGGSLLSSRLLLSVAAAHSQPLQQLHTDCRHNEASLSPVPLNGYSGRVMFSAVAHPPCFVLRSYNAASLRPSSLLTALVSHVIEIFWLPGAMCACMSQCLSS